MDRYSEAFEEEEAGALQPQEIRLLSKLRKADAAAPSVPGYFSYRLHMDVKAEASKFLEMGLLEVRPYRKRECLFLTDEGERLIQENEALLLYYNGLSEMYVSDIEIAEAQKTTAKEDSLTLLEDVYLRKIEEPCAQRSRRTMFGLYVDLQKIYRWQHDDGKVQWAQERLDALFEDFERERKENAEKVSKILGISLEERQRMYEQVKMEIGTEWEKELDARNRAKAGIE